MRISSCTLLSLAFAGLLVPALSSQVIFVDADATGANDGSSWQAAFTELGDGLSLAVSGSQVWVAEGSYLPPPPNGVDPRAASFQLGAGVELYGGFAGTESTLAERDIAAHPATLSGDLGTPGVSSDNAYHVLTAATGAARLDGLVLRDGRADGNGFGERRGSLLDSAAGNFAFVIHDCRFIDGHATDSGGAVTLSNSAEQFVNCHFEGNEANFGAALTLNQPQGVAFRACRFENNLGIGTAPRGGAIAAAGLFQDVIVRVEDSSFVQNNSGTGGAIHIAGGVGAADSLVVLRSVFEGNTALLGGALSLFVLEIATIDACRFENNSASNVAGAVFLSNTHARISRSRFLGNHSAHLAGAISASDTGTFLSAGSAAQISDTLFVGNSADRGGALFVSGGAGLVTQVTGCSFGANSAVVAGGGIQSESVVGQVGLVEPTVHVDNSVFWGNSDAQGMSELAQVNPEGGVLEVNRSILQGLTGALGGVGNLALDPLFVDLNGADNRLGTSDDNARLQANSPAIDAGDTSLLLADAADADCDTDLSEPQPLDLDGNVRSIDDPATPDTGAGGALIVDIGAYEFGAELPLDVWTNLGGGTLGVAGVPELSLSGTLCEQQLVAAQLTQAAPNATSLLWIANGSGAFPVFGGTLHAFPFVAQIIVSSDASGSVAGQTIWPSAVPSGLSFVFQFLVIDPGFGITLSNAMEGITP